MHLHVLAGGYDLLASERIQGVDLAEELGEDLRPATAFWLTSRSGRHYHEFLLEDAEDRRVKVFARSLLDNFGARLEPLIVLPELLRDPAEVADAPADRRAAIEVVREIHRHTAPATLTLRALALPEGVDDGDGWASSAALLAPALTARLEELRDRIAAEAPPGVGPVETRVTEVAASAEIFDVLFRNALAQQIAARAAPKLAKAGLVPRTTAFAAATAKTLAGWTRAGMVPLAPIGAVGLDQMSEQLITTLLSRAAIDG